LHSPFFVEMRLCLKRTFLSLVSIAWFLLLGKFITACSRHVPISLFWTLRSVS
jgi:hypothetical protein